MICWYWILGVSIPTDFDDCEVLEKINTILQYIAISTREKKWRQSKGYLQSKTSLINELKSTKKAALYAWAFEWSNHMSSVQSSAEPLEQCVCVVVGGIAVCMSINLYWILLCKISH